MPSITKPAKTYYSQKTAITVAKSYKLPISIEIIKNEELFSLDIYKAKSFGTHPFLSGQIIKLYILQI